MPTTIPIWNAARTAQEIETRVASATSGLVEQAALSNQIAQLANVYLPRTSSGEIHLSGNDTIQDGLNALGSGVRGTVYMAAKEYGITEPIVYRSGNRLVGCGTNYGASWRGTTIYPETGFPEGVPLIYSEGWGSEHLVQLVADAPAGQAYVDVDGPLTDYFGACAEITVDCLDQNATPEHETRAITSITEIEEGVYRVAFETPLEYNHATGDYCYGETFDRTKWAHWSLLESFRVEGRKGEGFSVHGIGANQGGEVSRLRDLFVRNCAGHGLYLWGVSAPGHVDGCSVFFSGGAGVAVRNIFSQTGGLTAGINNVRVWGLSGDANRELLLVEGSGMVTALGLKCEGAVTDVIRVRPTNALSVKADGITVNRSTSGGNAIICVDNPVEHDYGLSYPYRAQGGRTFSESEIDARIKVENLRFSGFNFTNVYTNAITGATRAVSTSPREYFFGSLTHNWLEEELS